MSPVSRVQKFWGRVWPTVVAGLIVVVLSAAVPFGVMRLIRAYVHHYRHPAHPAPLVTPGCPFAADGTAVAPNATAPAGAAR